MEIVLHRLHLRLRHPFTISRGTRTTQESWVVELRGEGISGWGEATPNAYYQQTMDSLEEAFQASAALVAEYRGCPPEQVWPLAMQRLQNSFAVSALDMAAHDWHARRHHLPTYGYWGLEWNQVPNSSYTIAIDTPEKMIDKLNEQPHWPVYKIKLGTDHDLEIVRCLRSATKAKLRVDANCAWNVQQTIDYSQELHDLGVEFIEQPLPPGAPLEDQRAVFQSSRLPILADESCREESDVDACLGRFHGINIKLCKCGGLTPALRMLRRARQLGLSTMVGCMLETSIGISAAAQLLPLLDYADLDGAALLADDPTEGVAVESGVVRLSHLPGHGAYLPDPRRQSSR